MPTIERTPLQQALLQHLGGQEELIHICTEAVNLGQLGADGEVHLFYRELTYPNGALSTVEQVIIDNHLNQFIQWGGEV